MTPGLIVNLTKEGARVLSKELIRWCHHRNRSLLLMEEESQALLGEPGLSLEQWCQSVDVAFVVGGDGTLLRAARRILSQNAQIPMFGINMGHLGFLATGTAERALAEVEQILNGQFSIQKHRLLEGTHSFDGGVRPICALNDVVLAKGVQARLISVAVQVHDWPLGEFRADGLIVSTPTGSTAYALSAGGPIVPPHVHCMVLAPICAHTLYSRPVILAPNDRLTLTPQKDGETFLSIDGQETYAVQPGDRVELCLSPDRAVSMITLPQLGYFELLQQKFMWGFDPLAHRDRNHD